MKLRIVRGEDKKGLVDIFLEDKKCGRVAAYFEAKENSVSAMIVTDDEQTKKLFEDNITTFESGISDGEQRVRIDVALEHDISAKESKMSMRLKSSLMAAKVSRQPDYITSQSSLL